MKIDDYYIEERYFNEKENFLNEYYTVKFKDNYYYFFRNQKENHLLIFNRESDLRTEGKKPFILTTKKQKEDFINNFKETAKTIKLKEIFKEKKEEKKYLTYFIRNALLKERVYLIG
jgi:hypothetical protein